MSVDTSHASKKLAPSSKKSATSKVGKKAVWPRQPKTPAPPTSPMKGGPLSPLTVGSSSVAASPEPETAAMAPAFLQDGPSNMHTKVKPHPLTKESKGNMKCALHIVYSCSDNPGADGNEKTDVAVKSGVSPGLDNVPKETLQKDLPSEVMQDDRPAGDQQEPSPVTNPIEDPCTAADSHDPHDHPANPP
ncbi:hypothetical protein BDR07DRAFT_1478913 [Suillus spraguei]|nr:hypothetical protein BDR07DRAFT_1478913 [Suillus spraguei]